jgi:glycosyltransferase involved in cell wall biosynthesis
MKILMSAFSCGPGQGSEPGVGWNTAMAAARLGHEVTVLTQTEFRAQIEREIADGRVPENLKFDMFMPAWLERVRDAGVKHGLSSMIWQPVSLVWQIYALTYARRNYRDAVFDLVHHVTFAQIRHPTLLTRLGRPTVLGPLGGADSAPMALRKGFPWKEWTQELVRDLYNIALRLDPITRRAFRDAAIIFLRTRAGLTAVPPRHRGKVQIWPGLAVSEIVGDETPARSAGEPLRLIYAGHLWYLKGVHLAIRALARARAQGVDVTLRIVGDGPAREDLRALARRLGLQPYIVWHGQVPRQKLLGLYARHHAFLFCSVRDAAPTVIVEAWAHGLPVICLAIGGPGEMVDASCGRAVATKQRSEDACVADVAAAIAEFAADEELRLALGRGAKARYRQSSWDRVMAALYAEIETRLTLNAERVARTSEWPSSFAFPQAAGKRRRMKRANL